jgi:hypothetical protein
MKGNTTHGVPEILNEYVAVYMFLRKPVAMSRISSSEHKSWSALLTCHGGEV